MFAAVRETFPSPWRFQSHVEVWLLVVSLICAYVYVVCVIGPKAVPTGGEIVTRKNVVAFVGAISLLWVASDWPIHDLAEEYLYSVHMFQHMVLSYFVPALALLATPNWLFQLLVGKGRTYKVVSWLVKPVVAAVIFNMVVMASHIPGVVNQSVSNGVLHYSMHVLLVTTALLVWMPVCGPERKFQMGPAGKMVYLFSLSVVPTIPAAWLTFADGPVYKHYDIPVRVWGISVIDDQQIAGAIMKLGGSAFLWSIIIFIFFKRFSSSFSQDQSYRLSDSPPTAEIVNPT